MGMCLQQDNTEESKNAKMKSSKIEQDLCEQAKSEVNVVKILMLGEFNCRLCAHHKRFLTATEAGWRFCGCFHTVNAQMILPVCVSGAAESGKSTLLKQIRILYSHGFSKPELVSFKVVTVARRGTSFQAVETKLVL